MRFLVHRDGKTWEADTIPQEVIGDGDLSHPYPRIWVSADGRGAAYEKEQAVKFRGAKYGDYLHPLGNHVRWGAGQTCAAPLLVTRNVVDTSAENILIARNVE